MLSAQQKTEIIAAATAYAADKGLTQTSMARQAGINPSYVSKMLAGQTTTNAGSKEVEIQDKWFLKLAEFVGFSVEKTYWQTLQTPQFLEIINGLVDAKENGTSGMLIGESGCGKTHMVDRFCNKNPVDTYRVTVSKLDTLASILERLLTLLSLNEKGRSANKLDRIVTHLKRLKREGQKVIIIIDEAENLRAPVFGMVKAMYDGIVNYASIMLVGTHELTDKMERLKRKNRDGMPQFCRRFKAGTRYITPIDRSFKLFFEKMDIQEKGLQRLLCNICENYGELKDYLEPAIKAADRRGELLTEDFFRLMYNMPK